MTTIQRIRVPVGFTYALVYLYFAAPRPVWFWAGLLLALVGLAIRIWAAGCLRKFEQLTLSGPYLWSRNPLYLGSFLIGLGFTLAGSQLWLLLVFLMLFVAVYLPVMGREEEELAKVYGGRFEDYRRSVSRFFPLPGGTGSLPAELVHQDQPGFTWRRVLTNREHRAVIGFAFGVLILFLKMVWAG